MAEIDTIQAVTGLVDKLSTFGFMLFMIVYLMRKLAIMEGLLVTDWKRQRDEEVEQLVKKRLSKELGNGTSL